MKKTWNRVIIISFVILALLAVGTIIFLFPYYNKYKVFDGIEAGRWNEVKESYDSLDAKQRREVQEILPDYAKHICLEYTTGEKDYTYTAAAYDAINSIDESQSLSAYYMDMICYVEYKKAIDAVQNSTQDYDYKASVDAQNVIAGINKRLDNDTRENILIEIMNEKYNCYIRQEITAEEVKAYINTVAGYASNAAKDYTTVVLGNIDRVEEYRNLYAEAQTVYEAEDYFTAINMCQAVVLDPADEIYIEKYYSLYSLAYATGMNYYDSLLDTYIDLGDNRNAVNLMGKMETYFSEDLDLTAAKLRMASDWQKAYIKLAGKVDKEIQTALEETEEGSNVLESIYPDVVPDSIALKDIDEDGTPEAFFYSSKEENDTYVTCFIFGYNGEEAVFLGYAKVRSFCSDSSFVAFPWGSTRESGDEYCLKRYEEGVITDGPYCQNVDGVYYVNGETVDEVTYLSASSEALASSLDQGVKDVDTATLVDSESYILAYK